ncbi:hypothetical protein RDWZM_003297 [Blomia tropicalis]|uniref:Uncharacterized protein n=1 Tax=Blomia tropicalis TaxID=40697 RepID=A0A9Q0MFK6_BLOTA|nr:hypothetical protein RDWZM_003297 [Blomia tropicalis]
MNVKIRGGTMLRIDHDYDDHIDVARAVFHMYGTHATIRIAIDHLLYPLTVLSNLGNEIQQLHANSN